MHLSLIWIVETRKKKLQQTSYRGTQIYWPNKFFLSTTYFCWANKSDYLFSFPLFPPHETLSLPEHSTQGNSRCAAIPGTYWHRRGAAITGTGKLDPSWPSPVQAWRKHDGRPRSGRNEVEPRFHGCTPLPADSPLWRDLRRSPVAGVTLPGGFACGYGSRQHPSLYRPLSGNSPIGGKRLMTEFVDGDMEEDDTWAPHVMDC